VLVLAMPNGKTEPLLTALEAAGDRPELLVDVSADARFKDDWLYSVPELQAERLRGVNRIANPGCYATAMQLALAPIVDRLAAVPHCFGVSGYSGAGSKPGPNNDVERLEGGVRPYGLNGHIHEREVSRQLGIPVRFAPSVAPFFRGIVLTALCEVDVPMTAGELSRFYRERYADAPLVRILGEEMPRVQEVVGTPHAFIGGLGVDPNHPRRISVVCTIDNLLKGAASQAVQNFNLALGIDPLTGLV
jgi:N-acetyl-gamma-glutamyl-phosphate reductase